MSFDNSLTSFSPRNLLRPFETEISWYIASQNEEINHCTLIFQRFSRFLELFFIRLRWWIRSLPSPSLFNQSQSRHVQRTESFLVNILLFLQVLGIHQRVTPFSGFFPVNRKVLFVILFPALSFSCWLWSLFPDKSWSFFQLFDLISPLFQQSLIVSRRPTSQFSDSRHFWWRLSRVKRCSKWTKNSWP
jgi:hypothetical protein